MLRVLVVDDEKNMRTTLRDILLHEGFDVSTAVSGEQAVEMCGRSRYDVVLLDVRLPGIDGVDALRRIRSNDAHARVLMMSAYPLEHVESEAIEEGAGGFLHKPLDPLDLIQRIADLRARNGPGSHKSDARTLGSIP